jgi:hypothetical protein
MMQRAAASLALLSLVACGETAKKDAAVPKKTATKTATLTATDTETATGTAEPAGGGGDEDFGVMPFLYGPYLADAFAGSSETSYAVEYGFLDIRRQNGLKTGADDLFDFRWKTVAAAASTEPLPKEASSGCGTVTSKTFGSAADTVAISGATSAELEAGTRNVFLFENVEQGAQGFDPTKGLEAKFLKDGDELATISADPPTGIGSVRISGAYDATLNINTGVRFLSDALKGATDALKLAEEGGGSYDLAVVTLIGGKGAKTEAIRCFIAPGGSVELAEASYKGLLPLRGFYVIYAKIKAAAASKGDTWAASIVGDGAYDQTVD